MLVAGLALSRWRRIERLDVEVAARETLGASGVPHLDQRLWRPCPNWVVLAPLQNGRLSKVRGSALPLWRCEVQIGW